MIRNLSTSPDFKATRRRNGVLGAVIAVILASPSLHGQTAESIVRWSARAEQGQSIMPGQRTKVTIHAQIKEGWHVYAPNQAPGGPKAMAIEVPDNQPFRLSAPVKASTPQTKFDANFEMNTESYEGSFSVRVPLLVETNSQPGPADIQIDVTFQTCNQRTCLPPATVHLKAPVVIGHSQLAASTPRITKEPRTDSAAAPTNFPGAPLKVQDSSQAPTPLPQTTAVLADPAKSTAVPASLPTRRGLGSLLWLAAAMGGLSLLTPCVFPMVPITVSYFTSHAGKNRRAAFLAAAAYGIGIIFTFTACGMALAVFYGAAGVNQLAANPWVNLLITAIFLAFAFALFETYLIRIPPGLLDKLSLLTRGREGNQIAGTLLMGVTFTLTSFTCTSPFVGTLLVMTAQGNWRWPLFGMLVFATVFAAPFIVLALAPQLISQLPKAGSWMTSVKGVMGFLEIAAAMKFLSNADLVWHWGIFTRQVVLCVWIGIGLLLVLNILGYLRMPHDSPVENVGALRFSVCTVFLVVTIWLVPGLFGRQLGELEAFLPPEIGSTVPPPGSANVSARSDWILNDYSGALTDAQRENKPLFIDFTGYTCTNCRWMEANMFPKANVSREMEKFVRARLYTDGDGEIYKRQQKMQQEKFGTVALPYYAILRPDGTIVATFPGLTRNEDDFVAFLKKASS